MINNTKKLRVTQIIAFYWRDLEIDFEINFGDLSASIGRVA